MNVTKFSLVVAAALVLCSGQVFATTVLIDPSTNNGSFELAGGVANTDKIQEWDTTPDIDNWVEWAEVSTAGNDSGVQNTGNASDGTMIAFLQANNAVRNMTSHVAAEGDQFIFSWDHVLREDREHRVGLVYNDGGVYTSIAASEIFSTGVLEGISGSYTIPAASPAIGKEIGLGLFANGTIGGGYPEVDNFVLTVVPEPGSVALAGLALVGLVATRSKRR